MTRCTVTRRTRRPPLLPVALAVGAVALLLAPLVGLALRAPWTDLWGSVTSEAALRALRLSLQTSLWATALAVVLGVPLAWVLARVEFPGRSLVRALTLLPLVLPPVVGGVALLYAFGGRGFVGAPLHDWFGIQLTFSTAGVVIAETFVAMPFLVITVESALRSMDRRYEDAAATLGAGRAMVFRRITLPLIAPALVAGAALAWARALGEFGATITFAGNVDGVTRTAPLAVSTLLDHDPGAAVALSLVMLVVSMVVLVSLRGRWLGLR